jgi:chemotaxis protein MotB
MKITASMFLSIFLVSLFCSGCMLAESKYLKKAEEADQLNQKVYVLEKENKGLKNQIKTLAGSIASLEAQNVKLEKNVSEVTKKSHEVEKQSNTFKELVQEMKGEIAHGQVTITELKGKLTVDVVDKILFASGESNVKEEGYDVLKRVVDILKKVQDKNIRIEGHTDNIKITSRLAKFYQTNWELSAARAINVTKYLQLQGIDPKVLSATAFGEFKPIADNRTPEGRAKNRRIAIILLPKE